MKLKDLKEWINSIPEEDLEKDIFYYSQRFNMSGQVNKITKIKENLYYTGEDDPVELYTSNELLEKGWTEEEIFHATIEIPKDSYALEI